MLPCDTQIAAHVPVTASPRPAAHWHNIAGQWDQVGPPLRPSAPDLAVYADVLARWQGAGVPRGLILGVTPELYRLPWPESSQVIAVDRTQRMIDLVWPGPRSDAVCADWTDLPLETASRDIVLCDGGIIMLPYPHGHAQLIRGLQRVMAPGGLCAFRLYVLPDALETPQEVLADLCAGRIANLNLLKLRLGMALQAKCEQGVQLGHVWDVLLKAAPDLDELASRIGWPLAHMQAIHTYRACPSRYYFLTLPEVCSLFTENPGGFILESVHVPTYALGERCPLVVFRRTESIPVIHHAAHTRLSWLNRHHANLS
jgi:SAM-dependent methyltransferase